MSPLEGTLANWAVWPPQPERPNKLTREGADDHCWKTPACHAILRLARSNRTTKRREMLKQQRKKQPVCTDLPQRWSLPSRNRATGTSDKRRALEVMCLNKTRKKIYLEIYSYGKSYYILRISQMHLEKISQWSCWSLIHKQNRCLCIWMEVSG